MVGPPHLKGTVPMEKKKVLVVEDNDLNLKLCLLALRASDATILVARNGDDAVVQVERENPDLVILDIRLPGRSGIEVAKAMRAMPTLKDVPILAVTACAMPGDKERILAAGCNYYIPKPIDTRAFPKIVHAILAGQIPPLPC